ncbi:hypothetical protein PHET_03808, partial [Paragonimus heterotremus]
YFGIGYLFSISIRKCEWDCRIRYKEISVHFSIVFFWLSALIYSRLNLFEAERILQGRSNAIENAQISQFENGV